MSELRLTPTQRVTEGSGPSSSTSAKPRSKRPKKPAPDLKSDVFNVAKAPPAEVAPTQAVGKAGAAELKKLFEDELHTLADRYRARYAPYDVKKKDHKWDIDSAEKKFRAKIDPIIDPKRSQEDMLADFQLLAHQFVNAINDYHVGMMLNRTGAARLPFRVRPIGDTFAISSIDREKLPLESFPFEVGDEVVEIDGKPVAKAVEANLAYLPHSNALTDAATASTMLTVRRGRVAEPMPTATTATVTIKRADGSVASHNLAWNLTAERIQTKPIGNGMLNIRAPRPDPSTVTLDMTAHRFIDRDAIEAAKKEDAKAVDPFLMDGRKTLLPDLGPIIFRTDAKNPFDAYVYRAPDGKNVGVIRLSSFGPEDPEKAVAAFAELIAKMEETTDALIIDQQNNPGGYFHYMMALLSMLSPEPLKMPLEHEKITPQEVADADNTLEELKDVKDDKSARKALGNSIVGYPTSLDLVEKMRSYAKHIKAQAAAGKNLTEGFPLEGIGVVNPSSFVTYSKPILCLVNATCYSCGDFFPAALKENKRAVIMGETTAGAGGYVIREKYLNRVGIDFVSITGSVADLSTKDPTRIENPLEGRGVEPHIKYSPSLTDLREDGADMKEAVNTTIMEMIAGAEELEARAAKKA